ncbi:MAG: hypothetical protein ABIB12_03025 [Patescibacteria group bacterium]
MFTTTGIAYALGFVALTGLSFRIFQYAKREPGTVSRSLFLFTGSFSLMSCLVMVPVLFFPTQSFALRLAVIAASFFQGLGCSFLGYLLAFFKAPRGVPPMFGFLFIFSFTMVATVLALVLPYTPHLTADGLSVVWEVPLLVNIPRIFYFVFTFFPLSAIFFWQFLTMKEPYARVRALGLGAVTAFGAVGASIEFLQKILGLSQFVNDLAFIFVYSLIIFVLLLSTRIGRRLMRMQEMIQGKGIVGKERGVV